MYEATPTRGSHMILLTTEELAEHLHTTVRHVRGLRTRGTIPVVKVGHLVRYDLEAVMAALHANSKDT